jgi:hypothetical protein
MGASGRPPSAKISFNRFARFAGRPWTEWDEELLCRCADPVKARALANQRQRTTLDADESEWGANMDHTLREERDRNAREGEEMRELLCELNAAAKRLAELLGRVHDLVTPLNEKTPSLRTVGPVLPLVHRWARLVPPDVLRVLRSPDTFVPIPPKLEGWALLVEWFEVQALDMIGLHRKPITEELAVIGLLAGMPVGLPRSHDWTAAQAIDRARKSVASAFKIRNPSEDDHDRAGYIADNGDEPRGVAKLPKRRKRSEKMPNEAARKGK